MNKKLVIFGPWCGEFCYELSWWIPEIRKVRNTDFKDWDALAVGFDGRKILYEDFTDGYVPYPKEIDDTLMYPATYGEHINGKDIIPENLKDFVVQVAGYYQSEGYSEIKVWWPGTMPISAERTLSEEIFGETRHYEASEEILNSIRDEISFDNDRETVAVMARIRHRNGNICKLDWNPKHWETFIDMLINDLKVNVVMIGIPRKEGSSAGGALSMEDTEMYKKNKDYIKPIVFTGIDSVERQIALLQSTRCSIYGASGTAVFPFFVKDAPTFTQQTKEEGFRLKWKWERDLTNNLKNVKVFDKYKNFDIFESSPEELFGEFKEFYNNIEEGICYE
tara:strand:+ start:2411 stop:3418 length:1008 start_codon:yes stop_codon:yes gene_type:complete